MTAIPSISAIANGGLGGKGIITASVKRGFQLTELVLGQLQGRGFEGNPFRFLSYHVLCIIKVSSLDETCHFSFSMAVPFLILCTVLCTVAIKKGPAKLCKSLKLFGCGGRI